MINVLLSLFVPFLYFSLSNFTTCILFKNKFGRCLPLTFMMNIVVVYLSQLICGTFTVGYIFLVAYAISSVLLYIFKKNRKEINNNIFTSGYVSFLLFYILAFILLFKKSFNKYDELMHWGVMVKEMLRTDKFYADTASTLMYHKDYPPFVSLFEMMWCKFGGGFSEANTTMALHTFIFSLIIHPIVEKDSQISKKVLIKNFVTALCIIVIVLHFDIYDLFSSIYLEIFLAALFAYNYYIILTEDNNLINNTTFLLSCITLLLSKQIGIAFLGLLLLTYFLKRVVFDNNKKKNIIFLVIVISLSAVFYWSWSHYVSQFDIYRQFSVESFSKISNIFGSNGYGLTVVKAFIKALFETNISNDILHLSYAGCALFFALIMLWLVLNNKRKPQKKEDIIIAIIVFLIGTIFYMLMLLFLYLFVFSKNEALKLASFDRYMASYVLAEFLAILLTCFEYIKNKFNFEHLLVILLVSMILLNGKALKNFIPAVLHGNMFTEFKKNAKVINSKLSENDSIYVISQSRAHDDVLIHFYSSDKYMAFSWDNYLTADYTNNNLKNRLENQLFKYDYVFVLEKSENFENNFSKYLVDSSEFKTNTIYKVTKDRKLIEV